MKRYWAFRDHANRVRVKRFIELWGISLKHIKLTIRNQQIEVVPPFEAESKAQARGIANRILTLREMR